MNSSEAARSGATRATPGMRFFIVTFLALHIPLFIYPVLRLCQWLDAGPVLTWLILVPVVAGQFVSRWLLRRTRHFVAKMLRGFANLMLGMSPIVVLTLLGFESLVFLEVVGARAAGLSVIGMALTISALGLISASIPFVKTVSFDSESLKAPLRFVQITDVHIGSRSSRFLRKIVGRIGQLEPEFLCITGDLVDAIGVSEEDLGALGELACPVYFSIGNHERYEDLDDILARLQRLGVKTLRTQAVHHRDDVQVLGIDDKDDAMQVERELRNMVIDRSAFGILMYHRPRGIEAAESAGIDLMLSGHTHNGQIFPFNLVVRRIFKHIVGMYPFGKSRLYVSQGVGTWGPAMRVGTRAEITLFEITPA